MCVCVSERVMVRETERDIPAGGAAEAGFGPP